MFYDAQRGIVIYHVENPAIFLQHVPRSGRLRLNGYVFAPADVTTLQAIRALGLPVLPPLDQGYDWPHGPHIKAPMAAQKIMSNFMAVHPRCFNLSDPGCVAGETLIETLNGAVPIEQLQGTHVRLLNGLYAPAICFAKGRAALYRVKFASGRSIVVTHRHVFLTLRGWRLCADLQIGECLPICEHNLPASIAALAPSMCAQDVPRSSRKERDYREYWRTPACDAPPLCGSDSGLADIPLPDDFPTRIHAWSRTDARETTHRHSSSLECDPLAKPDCGVPDAFAYMEVLPDECATTPVGDLVHIYEQYRLLSNLARPARADQEWPFYNVPVSALDTLPFDTVIKITYEREDVYYDMHVPNHEHYMAHGLCHHNTGKTLAALWAADYLMQNDKERFRALVVAPLSSLRDTWEQEINANFLNRRSCAILHGTEKKRLAELNQDVDFYIINVDGIKVGARRDTRRSFTFTGLCAALRARTDIRLIIFDESSYFRDASTARSRIARALLSPKPMVWQMTGTPTPNGPEDAHGLKKLLAPWWPETKTSWRSRTMLQVSQYDWRPRLGATKLVAETLQPAVRFSLEECVDLPPMITQTREVELTSVQADMLKKLKAQLLLATADGKTISAVHAAALRIKFLQIISGAVYDDEHSAHAVPCGPRVAVLREVIEESNDKLIVFAPFTSVVNMLDHTFKHYTHEVVTGATPERKRADIFSRFRSERDPRMIIADPGTMSHSLNLTIAKTIVWWAPTDKTEVYLQANRRVRRPGQDKPQRIVHLVSHRIEREIFRRLQTNTDLQNVMLGLIEKERTG